MPSRRLRRADVRRVVVVMPSAFTLGNLFFGFWAIVAAFNGNFTWAGYFIVFAGVLDMLDGRIARMSNAGSKFGAELDSLVDVVSFGVAPALLMYFLEFQAAGRFAWLVCYVYVVAAALRLARFNVLADRKPASGWFTGLPSPSAGMTLAVYYPFSQTEWYSTSLAYLNFQHEGLAYLIILLALLMVSNVKYPKFPPIGFRSARGIGGLVFTLALLVGGLLAPEYILFPFGLAYMAFGLVRAAVLAFMEREEEAPAEVLETPTTVPLFPGTRRSDRGDRRQESSE
ncbi:MAG TPA: CDP-diacylglycerol--serine O-phosphatidyltransferase [Gemmatimonadales bacterium]|nr:CDP-diacylglycerol--serine O-phosphatidyltransferase [Gemmatimonadales bacterium]